MIQPFISEKLAVMKLKRLSVIPTKIIKLNKDLVAKFIAENFNSCIDEGEFPSELKHADIVPIHKKKDKRDIGNYRPVTYYLIILKYMKN